MLKIGIAGAAGRMGKMLMQAVYENQQTDLRAVSCRFEEKKDMISNLNQYDFENFALAENEDELVSNCEAVIDFTSPEYSILIAEKCAELGKIYICGTTGFNENQLSDILQYAEKTRIVKATNFSIGVNLLAMLTKQVATLLDDNYDIEIIETHHRYKKDAPSGTALTLGEAAANGRKTVLNEVSEYGRVGITGVRVEGNIGFHALRGGDVIGDHSVIFAGNGERIELTHKASNRRIYADGAIKAALWVQNKPNGLYSIHDILSS